MTEKEIALEVRLNALEYMQCLLFRNFMLYIGGREDALAAFDKMATNISNGLKHQTFPGISPEWSDHFSDEMQVEVGRLLQGVRDTIQKAAGT